MVMLTLSAPASLSVCNFSLYIHCVCKVSAVGKISDYHPVGHGFNLQPGQEFSFGRPSFATPSVGRDVLSRWSSLSMSYRGTLIIQPYFSVQ